MTPSYNCLCSAFLTLSDTGTAKTVLEIEAVNQLNSFILRWIHENTEPKFDGLCGFYFSLLAGVLSICISLIIAFLGILNGIPGASLSILFVVSLYTNIFIPYKVET